MQVSCPRKELHEAVQFVSSGVVANTPQQILTNILIDGSSDGLRMMASDLRVWVERSIPSIVGDGGRCTVPARVFSDILGSLPDENVLMVAGDRYDVQVSSRSSNYNIMGLAPEEFPPLPVLESGSSFTIPLAVIREMAKKVGIAVSKDDAREALTGVLFLCDGTDIKMVATDTHRLALSKTPASRATGIGSTVNAVIPERAIGLLSRAPAADNADVTVTMEGTRAAFDLPGVRLVATLITGAFPSYERVIPTESTRKWTLPTEELTDAVKRAEIVAKQSSHRVILRAENSKLFISAKSDGLGDASEELEMVQEGDDMSIAFNARYLLDGLGVVDSDGVAFEMTESLRPALLRPASDGEDFVYVVMPMSAN